MDKFLKDKKTRRLLAIALVAAVAAVLLNLNIPNTSAAIAYVNSNSGHLGSSNVGTTVTSTLNNTTAGDLLVITAQWYSGTGPGFYNATATDSQGNTLVVANSSTMANTHSIETWYAQNIAGGADTVTLTVSADSVDREVDVVEYSGVAQSGALDVAASATSTGTLPDSGPVTTTAANDLLVGAIYNGDNGTASPGAGYTQRQNLHDLLTEDEFPVAVGTYDATSSLSASATWGAQIAAFKPGGAKRSRFVGWGIAR